MGENINQKIIQLTDSQMGVYLECVDDPNSLKYNITFEWKIEAKKIDKEKLKKAYDLVIKNHKSFHTSIIQKNGSPYLVEIDGEKEVIFKTLKEKDYDEFRKSFASPFVFNGEYLYKTVFVYTEEYVHILVDIHHLIFDGESLAVCSKELQKAYSGQKLEIEEGNLFTQSLIDEQEKNSIEVKECYDFFENYLADLDSDSRFIPDINIKEKEQNKTVTEREVNISEGEIISFAKSINVSENIVFLGAFSYVLGKFTAQNDISFISVENGRFNRKDLTNSTGMFVKTFPVRIKVDEIATIKDYLQSVKESFVSSLKHDKASFIELANKYGVNSSISYVYQGSILYDFEYDGIKGKTTVFEDEHAIDDFNLMVFKENGKYKLTCLTRSSLYSQEYVNSILQAIVCAVSEFIVKEKLASVNLVDKEQLEKINEFNNNSVEYDAEKNVIDIYNEQVKKYPNNIAVSYKEKEYSYLEFDKITSKIANYVIKKGIGKDEFVAILVNRNEYMPLTAFGVVKAGAGYQPLDPTYPQERLNFMVNDSKAKLLICDRELRGILSEYKGEVLYTDEIDLLSDSEIKNVEITKNNSLIIIYTSGTTGTPKGCVLEHKNIVCFNYNHTKIMGITSDSRVSQYASFGFDAGVMDIFTTLMNGATLCIIPEEIRLDLTLINEFFIANRITHGFMTTQMGRMFAELTTCKTLKALLLGGEKLVPFNPPKEFKVINGYGPSETIAYVTHFVIKDDSPIQPIGVAHNNTKLYVVDKNMNMMPIGACGELCISGNQVGRGYLGREEKTKEVFILNPFDAKKGYERIYRTGDIVRLLPNGNYDFVGRRDGQVKIRGFRIELTEVEKVIRSYKGIKNATVQAFDDVSGGKYICAYIVSDDKIDIQKLNEYITETKPAYMVPAVTMQVDSIPVNVNGKVDKKKLPKPQREIEEIIKPNSEIEKRLFSIVSDVLGCRDFGINTDLFSIGLSSIGSIKLNVAIDQEFNVPIQMKDLKNLTNIQRLATYIDSNSKNEKQEKAQEIYLDYPLTKTQEGIYIECMSNPNDTTYNIPLLLKIDSGIDLQRLKSAIVQVVQAHNYINTRLFLDAEGVVRQKRPSFDSFGRNNIEEITVNNIDSLLDSLVKPFKLLEDRLFRVKIIRENVNYLFFDFHHIIADGTSYTILIKDIERAYNGEKIEDEKYSGFDRSLDEVKARNSTEYNDAENYYTKLLDGVDTDFLPQADLHALSKKGSGKLIYFGKENIIDRFKNFLDKHELSANAFLCSAFGYTLSLYNGSDYSVFTTVYNGRNDSRLNGTISMLVKTLPVVSKHSENIIESIKKMSNQLLDSMTYDIYSFAEISHNFGVKSDVMFIFQGEGFTFDRFCDKKAEEVSLTLSKEKAPFVLQTSISNGKIKYDAEYDSNRYTEEYIKSFIKALERVISEYLSKEKYDDIVLVDKEEREKIDGFNNNEMFYDAEKNTIDIYKEQVKKYPENIAVSYNDKAYTYLEFDRVTNKVANYVVEKGIGKDEFVAILVNRNEFMAIASVGVVKAGAGYQPLDPTYPQERLNFMVNDSKAKLLICDRELSGLISEYDGEILYTDEIDSLKNECEVNVKISPNDALIIIYTSGTTGTPKGCILEHKNIVCFFHNHQKIIEFDSRSKVGQYASFGFDAGVMDIFSTLMAGATLCIIPDAIRLDLTLIDDFCNKYKITHMFMTTQVCRMFIGITTCKTLKILYFGGEKLVPFNPPKDFRVMNGYGPSETIAYVTHYDIQNDCEVQPIGVAHNNTKLYVVDKNMNMMPIGACGELCISGNQVGRGYLGREEKTKEVFKVNPFDAKKGYERLYRTGDIVRLLPDGNYDFVGRRDGQVKIRGFRVELTEVEKVIRSYKGIENATVQAYTDVNGGKYLVAYITSKEQINIDEVNKYILKEKPSYMVPSVTMQIDSIPLNANGKVDKKKLPIPERKERVGLEPSNETEKKICEIFAKVLGIKKVYADDDFFEIGGTSILALQLVVKLDNEGYNIVYKNIFENTTPKQLAEFVSGAVKEKDYFAPIGEEAKKHNYSSLEYNVIENIDKISRKDIGDVLLTGATGFLGSHIFIDLLDNSNGKIICIIRDKKELKAIDRLKTILEFYFERILTEKELERVVVISGDLSDSNLETKLSGHHFDTILNCAANVKHFGNEESFIKDNTSTVEILINLAKKRDAVLVHASSMSVSGESVDGNIKRDFLFAENNLNIGQSLENMYVRSKYLAEEKIVDAISNGLKGKIVRFGNLMGRSPDGEFQINAEGSGFLRLLKGYIVLGCYPIEQLDEPIEFSPIDCSARAMVLLAGTPKEYTCFHANSSHGIHFANVFEALSEIGINVEYVSGKEYEKRYKMLLESKDKSRDFSGLLAYQNNIVDGKVQSDRFKVPQTNKYTVKALYRLGFSWPIADINYLKMLLKLQKENGFFDI